MATAAVPPSFPSLEAEAAFWRERAAVAEAAARDAREELEEFQVRKGFTFDCSVLLVTLSKLFSDTKYSLNPYCLVFSNILKVFQRKCTRTSQYLQSFCI